VEISIPAMPPRFWEQVATEAAAEGITAAQWLTRCLRDSRRQRIHADASEKPLTMSEENLLKRAHSKIAKTWWKKQSQADKQKRAKRAAKARWKGKS
jgi:hypothetical protein